jgi:transcriptional regulator with XRE-family HTH domain
MSYEEEWKYVSNRITELRKERGWSIQALADYSNIERADLSRIESGKANGIYFSTLCKIAEALDVPPGELVRK